MFFDSRARINSIMRLEHMNFVQIRQHLYTSLSPATVSPSASKAHHPLLALFHASIALSNERVPMPATLRLFIRPLNLPERTRDQTRRVGVRQRAGCNLLISLRPATVFSRRRPCDGSTSLVVPHDNTGGRKMRRARCFLTRTGSLPQSRRRRCAAVRGMQGFARLQSASIPGRWQSPPASSDDKLKASGPVTDLSQTLRWTRREPRVPSAPMICLRAVLAWRHC